MRLITNPRPQNTDIQTDIVTVEPQPINLLINDNGNTIPQQTNAQFLERKFVCFAPTHHSAVVMGSTTQDNKRDAKRIVLDASKVAYCVDRNNIRTDMNMVLANGDDTAHAHDAESFSYFIQETFAKIITINQYGQSENSNVISNKELATLSSYYDNIKLQSTLSAVKLNNKNKDNITAYCVNLGDNVFLVLDGTTGQVKQILNPRYELENGKQVPIHLQSLKHKSNPYLYIDRAEFHLQPNDIVILGTAGFVNSLDANSKTYSVASKEGPQNQVTFVMKEIDIDKLNARLKIIFANLRQQYPIQPPACAIAEALVKDAAHISLEDRQRKQRFVQGMRIKIREFKKLNWKFEENQYKESSKEVRNECTKQCLAYNYSLLIRKIMEFRVFVFHNKFDAIPPVDSPILTEFFQVISQKLLQKQCTNHEVSVKDKIQVTESNEPELTPEQIIHLIIDTLKAFLLKNTKSQEYVNELMDVVVIIFRDEIRDFAEKLSVKPITVEAIERFGKLFLDILLHKSRSFDLTKYQFLNNFRNQWSNDLNNWVEDDRTPDIDLSGRLIKFFTKYFSVDEENVKKDFWWFLRYVHYLDLCHQEKIKELPYLNTTIAQFIDRISGIVPHEEIHEINQYITENRIDKSTPMHQIESHLSLMNKSYGDDTTVTVAYVLDPALEIVRAMMNYCRADVYNNGVDTGFKNKCEDYWKKLCNLYPDKKPTAEALNLLITKLRAEQQVGQLEPTDHCDSPIGGKKLEDLKSHTVYSYTEDEIVSLEQFISLKIKLHENVTAIKNVTVSVVDKLGAHNKLNTLLCNPRLSALEICGLYNELTKTQFDKLNQHRNSLIDYLLGITITRSWSATLKVLRDHCLSKLMTEVNQLIDNNGAAPNCDQYIKALALLNIAAVQPLFNTHRSNSIFTGAYGDTLAVKAIHQRIVIVTDALSTLQNSKTEGIELKPIKT